MKSELEVASDEDIKKFKYLADNIDNEYSENAYLYSIEVYYENTYAPFEAYKNISQTILIALPEPIEFESTTHISN